MSVREQMIEMLIPILSDAYYPSVIGGLVDMMISRGVTIQRWIPVSEPPKVWEDEETKVMVDYLVYSPEYGIFVAHWCEPAERWLVDGESVRVTHWRPMPEAPKGD